MPGAATKADRSRGVMRLLATGCAVAAVAVAIPASAASEAVYRFYNRDTGTHFYTVSLVERDSVIRAFPQFAYEGATFAAPSAMAGTVPVFRFYNTKTGTH